MCLHRRPAAHSPSPFVRIHTVFSVPGLTNLLGIAKFPASAFLGSMQCDTKQILGLRLSENHTSASYIGGTRSSMECHKSSSNRESPLLHRDRLEIVLTANTTYTPVWFFPNIRDLILNPGQFSCVHQHSRLSAKSDDARTSANDQTRGESKHSPHQYPGGYLLRPDVLLR